MNISAATARVLLAAGVAAGTLAVVSACQKSADPGAADAAPNAVFLPASGNVPLQVASGSLESIIDTQLPAGHWVVQAKANAVNFQSSEDFVRCGIFVDNQAAGVGSTAHVGGHKGGGGTIVGLLTNIATVQSAVPVDLQLICSHDRTVPDGSPVPYIEDGALLATRHSLVQG